MRWVTNQGKNQTQMQIVYPSNVKSQHISSNCQVPNTADAGILYFIAQYTLRCKS